ncbi:unnamed protein product [Moneuplotes crassus]|uniref:Uncharacterized protein n=1 Tax=Euplotes crassus TaxID=5936 RepID=A0AAD1UG61_EUPCR|nr:unnamed protein product [Moneuplotes crassus]
MGSSKVNLNNEFLSRLQKDEKGIYEESDISSFANSFGQMKVVPQRMKRKRYVSLGQELKTVNPIPYDEILQEDQSDTKSYSRFEAFLKFELAEKEVVVKNNKFKIEYQDKLRGKMHYSIPGEWINLKGKIKNKYCVNNYVNNNEPVFLAKTAEKSLPKSVKRKLESSLELEPKYASYFPLWQIHPDFSKSHKKLEKERNEYLNSIVSLPKFQKQKKLTRDDIISSLRRGIRKKKLQSIYSKMHKAFHKRYSCPNSCLKRSPMK